MHTRTLLLLVLVALMGPAGSRAGAGGVPDGLSTSDWNSIRAEYKRHRQAVFPVEGGHRARNFGQQWVTEFDGRGFLVTPDSGGWKWGLQLESYGWAGRARAVTDRPRVTIETERVTYDWDETLREWYVNGGRGLEHGFTVRQQPAGRGDTLELNLAVRGGLEPRVREGGRAVTFVDAKGRTAVTYSGLKAWDAEGRALDARMGAAGGGLRLKLKAGGARYPLTIDPIVQQAYLKASNPGFIDFFGYSVAISGDTAVVGAFHEDSNATGVNGNQGDNSALRAGAAYVFVRNGGVWSQQAYLKASNTDGHDQFGRSVAISGDTAVVGAFHEDSNATGVNGNQGDNSADFPGAAYVFVRNGGAWSQQAYLKASNTGVIDSFGELVAISGDTVVVGAFRESSKATGVNGNQGDNSADFAGAAYVFVRNGGAWSQQAYLKASNTGAFDQFGASVAISGDTVVVGAWRESSNATGVNGNQGDNSAAKAGAAYVFVRNGGAWSQQAYLKASNTGGGDWFGFSVAISGDTVVVGAPNESSNATGVNGNQGDNSAQLAGAAYVFVRNGGVWSQQAYLKASNTDKFDGFGHSVAISGDTAVVGALYGDLFNPGAAYVFSVEQPPFTSDGLVHAARFEAGDVAEQEIVSLFGLFLADFNADAVLPLGTQLGGASVDVTDSQGVTRPCLMFAARVETDVSSAQLNFIIAGGTATGPATLTVRRASGGSHSITIHVVDVAPGIFTANSSGSGVPAANALRFVDGQLTDTSLVFDVTAFPFQATPIDLGPANHQVFLSLFATGIRNGGTVEVTIGGVAMTTIFGPAPSSEFDGLDQLNVLLERVLIGRGLVEVVVTVDGRVANVVEINIL